MIFSEAFLRVSSLLRKQILSKTLIGFGVFIIAPVASIAGISSDVSRTSECTEAMSSEKKPLVTVNPENFKFHGLTVEGLSAIKQARDIIRERATLFRNELRDLGAVHHAGIVARLFKGNMLLYGPSGGAKSKFVNWLMSAESEPSFKLQLHQMISEQAFVGGQNFDAAKLGIYDVNTKGSVADFVVALIDETEKGNPAALASLLSLLNEREILAGNKVIQARLETLFATSNANLAEIFQYFDQGGQPSTAPALLNRFQFKAFIYNWLSIEDQAFLDQRVQQKRYLEAVAQSHPELNILEKHELFLKPKVLDWSALRQLANSIFEPSPLFMTSYREFVNDMRLKTNQAIRTSEEKNRSNREAEPFIYFPSADYTERLRQPIPEIIVMSAFVDFLMSPLADDATIEQLTKKQIVLDPLSLWRGYLAMTTVGPGEVKLKINQNEEQKVDIDFRWSTEISGARDKREELLIQNLKSEQERFRQAYLKQISELSKHIEIRARNSVQNKVLGIEDASFEVLMMRYQQGD